MALAGSRRKGGLLRAGEGKDIAGVLEGWRAIWAEAEHRPSRGRETGGQISRGWPFILLTTSSHSEPITRLSSSLGLAFYMHCLLKVPALRAQVAVISLPFMCDVSIDLNGKTTLKVWRASGPLSAGA